MKFTVVCTDLDTGKPVYHECPNGDVEDIEWMRASASIPVASRPVKLEGKRLLDGGVSDPIPVKWMLSRGYEKNVVVLTRETDPPTVFSDAAGGFFFLQIKKRTFV